MGELMRIGIFGASGFVGGELLRLLERHPSVEITRILGGGAAGRPVVELHPHLHAYPGRTFGALDPDSVADDLDVALLALPHGEGASVAGALLGAGVRVIDLAGDFRLEAEAYPRWYGFEHPAEPWLEKAVYGLPELFADEIAEAQLVANPGCYPTPAILGLAPLLRTAIIEPDGIVIDAKSGVSGAGRAPTETSHFAFADGSVRPYRAGGVHPHTPEIERYLGIVMAQQVSVTFVPHLVPATRGLLATCYARLARPTTAGDLLGALGDAYADAPFVRVLPEGMLPDTKRVTAANVVELGVAVDARTGTAIVMGAIDNLVKGAAGQAIQNLNCMLGLSQTIGLEASAVYP